MDISIMNTENIILKKLTPNKNMHLKDINTGDIAEGEIYLGKFDSEANYVEVTEAEYQEWLKLKEEEELARQQEELENSLNALNNTDNDNNN